MSQRVPRVSRGQDEALLEINVMELWYLLPLESVLFPITGGSRKQALRWIGGLAASVKEWSWHILTCPTLALKGRFKKGAGD